MGLNENFAQVQDVGVLHFTGAEREAAGELALAESSKHACLEQDAGDSEDGVAVADILVMLEASGHGAAGGRLDFRRLQA